MQTVISRICRKLRFFCHKCRIDDERLVKTAVFGITEGENRRERPSREWLDDIKEFRGSKNIKDIVSKTSDRRS